MSRVLGQAVAGSLTADEIEWWLLPDEVSYAMAEGSELSAVCPVTNQPDLYDFELTFYEFEPEGKALKMYLLGFRDEAISCAGLAARIARELHETGKGAVQVLLRQTTRGGMRLSAQASAGSPRC